MRRLLNSDEAFIDQGIQLVVIIADPFYLCSFICTIGEQALWS